MFVEITNSGIMLSVLAKCIYIMRVFCVFVALMSTL